MPSLTLAAALVLLIAAVLAFFGLVSRLLDLLRPRRVIAQIVERTGEAARATYPFELREDRPVVPVPQLPVTATVRHEGRAGVLSALDRARLVRAATAAGAVVAVEIEVGGLVPTGAVLFTVRAQREPIDKRELRRAAILAEERTITLDPSFGIRAIVDLALRALSPAVNDPTTAVHALDGLDELLRELAVRDLDRGHVLDEHGALRLLYPNPGWNELLDLALTEIRHYGADSPQIARRLRALLLGLAELAPELRRPAVEAQLVRLDAAVVAAYDDPVEREHAMRRDRVGIGGHADARAPGTGVIRFHRRELSASVRSCSLRTIESPSSTPIPGLARSWSAAAPRASWTVTWAERSVSVHEPPMCATTPCALQSSTASTMWSIEPRSGALICTTSAAPAALKARMSSTVLAHSSATSSRAPRRRAARAARPCASICAAREPASSGCSTRSANGRGRLASREDRARSVARRRPSRP